MNKEKDKLKILLEKFRTDEQWNTLESDGTHRFDKEIAWIETMITQYAEALAISTDEAVILAEKGRGMSWPNYYQESNFPGINSDNVYGVYETFEEFRNIAKESWKGYRCPKCGDISPHPQECTHRLKHDGKCDWCSCGLFRDGKGVVILEAGLGLIPIFEPVPKECEASNGD